MGTEATQSGTADSGTVTDAALLVAIAERDRRSLQRLYERHAPWLLARLSRRCADSDLVDQALQDTFVAIWRKPSAYAGTGDVAAWMWGIAIRRLLDHLRRGRRRPAMPQAARLQSSAEEEVLIGVEHGDLKAALNRLSPELRAVVQATVLDGLTTREAGRLLAIPAGTVKTRMARARVQLREALT